MSLTETASGKKTNVLWVGLSDKPGELPLGATTLSGRLLSEIEHGCSHATFSRVNLVHYAPLHEGSLRYPTREEMRECYPHLMKHIGQLRPSVVFLLGRQVSMFVCKQLGVQDTAYGSSIHEGIRYVSIPHPSFMSVYGRKEKAAYVAAVRRIISAQAGQQ